jgi:hypothetical protein
MALFKEGGWTVRNEASITNHLEIQVIGVGILVRGTSATASSPSGFVAETFTMKYLKDALGSLKLKSGYINWHPNEGNIPEIVIGSKPDIAPIE